MATALFQAFGSTNGVSRDAAAQQLQQQLLAALLTLAQQMRSHAKPASGSTGVGGVGGVSKAGAAPAGSAGKTAAVPAVPPAAAVPAVVAAPVAAPVPAMAETPTAVAASTGALAVSGTTRATAAPATGAIGVLPPVGPTGTTGGFSHAGSAYNYNPVSAGSTQAWMHQSDYVLSNGQPEAVASGTGAGDQISVRAADGSTVEIGPQTPMSNGQLPTDVNRPSASIDLLGSPTLVKGPDGSQYVYAEMAPDQLVSHQDNVNSIGLFKIGADGKLSQVPMGKIASQPSDPSTKEYGRGYPSTVYNQKDGNYYMTAYDQTIGGNVLYRSASPGFPDAGTQVLTDGGWQAAPSGATPKKWFDAGAVDLAIDHDTGNLVGISPAPGVPPATSTNGFIRTISADSGYTSVSADPTVRPLGLQTYGKVGFARDDTGQINLSNFTVYAATQPMGNNRYTGIQSFSLSAG